MARRHAPPMTRDQILREIQNWGNVLEAKLIPQEEHDREVACLKKMLAKREVTSASSPHKVVWLVNTPKTFEYMGWFSNPFEDDERSRAESKFKAILKILSEHFQVTKIPPVLITPDNAQATFTGRGPNESFFSLTLVDTGGGVKVHFEAHNGRKRHKQSAEAPSADGLVSLVARVVQSLPKNFFEILPYDI